MAARILDIHQEATQEIISAIIWYMEQSPSAADGFIVDLNQRLTSVLHDPHRFAKYLYRTRQSRLRSYPYLIVYRFRRSVVQVVAVAHTSRRPGYWAKRRFDTEAP